MDDNSGNIDNLVLGELDNTIDGDAVLNQYINIIFLWLIICLVKLILKNN